MIGLYHRHDDGEPWDWRPGPLVPVERSDVTDTERLSRQAVGLSPTPSDPHLALVCGTCGEIRLVPLGKHQVVEELFRVRDADAAGE